jgi:Fic family protein
VKRRRALPYMRMRRLDPIFAANIASIRLILNKLLDGFDGKLTSSKWAKLTKSSQDTAQRDITDLVQRGILVRSEEGGRSTSYTLAPVRS